MKSRSSLSLKYILIRNSKIYRRLHGFCGQSTDKPTFKKAISQNAQIIVKQSMFALAKRGAGAKPLQKETLSSWGASADRLAPKDLVTRKLFFARRGAGDVVCTAPTQLKVYEYGKSLCGFKIIQWFWIILPFKVRTFLFDFGFTIIHIKFYSIGTAPPL